MKLKKKVSGIIISSILCSNFFVSSVFASDKNIEYKLGNHIIKTEKKLDDNMIKINLPESDFGTFYIKNMIDNPEKTTFILGYEKFQNVNTNEKYIILRDETNKVIKAYNTKQLLFTNFDLMALGLSDKYSYGEVVLLNNNKTTIRLKSIKEDANIYAKTKKIESQNELIFNYENSKNPNALNITLKFTINNVIVKELQVKVDKYNRPNIKEVEYQGKKYRINNMILPIITEIATITIPIDSAFLGTNIVHTEKEQNFIDRDDKSINTTEDINIENGNTITVSIENITDNNIASQEIKPTYTINKNKAQIKRKESEKKTIVKQEQKNNENITHVNSELNTSNYEKDKESDENNFVLTVEEKIKDKSIVSKDRLDKSSKDEAELSVPKNNNISLDKTKDINVLSKKINTTVSSEKRLIEISNEAIIKKENKISTKNKIKDKKIKTMESNINNIFHSTSEDIADKSIEDFSFKNIAKEDL